MRKTHVVGADGDGRAVGQDARDLAPRAAAEGARLAVVAGAGVVDEQDAAEREEAPQAARSRRR